MWKEILWVKPKVDQGDAKRMERTLSQRFQTATRRFGMGLKGIIKGSVFGLSLGVLSKLLNPLEAVQDKVKSLLEQGADIRDLADRFNTEPGKIKRLQDVASSLGLEPEKLAELMEKYAKAVEEGQKDLEAGNPLDAGSQAVSEFSNEKDLAEGFFKFIQSLSGDKNRGKIEEAVFGEKQYGAAKRFINADFAKQFAAINEPSAAVLTKSVNNAANAGDVQAKLKTQRETEGFVKDTKNPLEAMVRQMEASNLAQARKESEDFSRFQVYKKAADEITEVKNFFQEMNFHLLNGIGQIRQLISEVQSLKNYLPRWLRGGGDK